MTNLVDHHDSQKVADRSEKQAIQVVLHCVADRSWERVKNDLPDSEEEHPESNISQRPAILQGPRNKNYLHDDIN